MSLPRNIHRQRQGGEAATDLGVVLLRHFRRTSRTPEQALERAFHAAIGQLRTLAQSSQHVENELRERAERLRAAERRARGEPERQPLDRAGLL